MKVKFFQIVTCFDFVNEIPILYALDKDGSIWMNAAGNWKMIESPEKKDKDVEQPPRYSGIQYFMTER